MLCLIFVISLENLGESIEKRGIQPWPLAYIPLLNKPYENEVTLTRQNLPLKYCKPLELLTQLKRGIDL